GQREEHHHARLAHVLQRQQPRGPQPLGEGRISDGLEEGLGFPQLIQTEEGESVPGREEAAQPAQHHAQKGGQAQAARDLAAAAAQGGGVPRNLRRKSVSSVVKSLSSSRERLPRVFSFSSASKSRLCRASTSSLWTSPVSGCGVAPMWMRAELASPSRKVVKSTRPEVVGGSWMTKLSPRRSPTVAAPFRLVSRPCLRPARSSSGCPR